MLIKTILNFILLIWSSINILKCKVLNLDKANFFTLKKSSQLINNRSVLYSKIKINTLNQSINFVRSTSFSLSINSLFKLKNIVILNSYHDFFYLIENYLLNKKKNSYYNKVYRLFKSLNIKQFKMIDDYRYLDLFIPICKKLNIKSIGYMHGRISKDLKYQKNSFHYSFDEYYVWNKYYKQKILEYNTNYKSKNILVKNPFKKKIIRKSNRIEKVMIIHEDGISLNFYKNLVYELKKQKNIKVYLKFRPNNIKDIKLINFLNNNNVVYFHKQNLKKLYSKFNIDVILANNSSILIESSIYRIIPIAIYDYNPKIREFKNDKIVICSNIRDLSLILKRKKFLNSRLNLVRKKLWG